MVNAESEQVGISGRAREPRRTLWSDAEWIACTDGKTRPVEPGTFPLAYGVSARVAKLRALGNAIVPQVAAEFIGACKDAMGIKKHAFSCTDGNTMVCACGKIAMDGIRCRLGATHKRRALPRELSHGEVQLNVEESTTGNIEKRIGRNDEKLIVIDMPWTPPWEKSETGGATKRTS